jgi:hypothetical protein
MAKKHDDSPDTILFAEGGATIGSAFRSAFPVGVIEQVIQLKEPPAGNETASAFAALARRNMPMTPPGIGMGMAPGIAPGTQGRPSEMVMRQATGGGGPGGGPGGLQCIVWHEVCGWTTLYISVWA